MEKFCYFDSPRALILRSSILGGYFRFQTAEMLGVYRTPVSVLFFLLYFDFLNLRETKVVEADTYCRKNCSPCLHVVRQLG